MRACSGRGAGAWATAVSKSPTSTAPGSSFRQDMSGALLKDVILNRADVSFSIFDRAELTRVRMVEANLQSCSFVGARLVVRLWAPARAGKVRRRGDRRRAIRSRLPRPLPGGEPASRARAFATPTSAIPLSTKRCSSIATCAARTWRRNDGLGTTTLTRFERCDLRDTRWEGRDIDGAVFIDCRFHGASGRPARIAGVRIEWPDISPTDDGRRTGRDDDVLALWHGQGVEP